MSDNNGGMTVIALGFAAALAFGSYWVWPTGITDIPLSAITLGNLLWAALSVGLGFLAVVIGLNALDN